MSDAGNFEGKSILHLPHDLEAVARSEGMESEQLRERLHEARDLLLEARNLREPPFRDEKILASWNGMAFRALAEAGGALGRESYLQAGVSGLDFVLSKMRRDNRLLRSYKAACRASTPSWRTMQRSGTLSSQCTRLPSSRTG